MVCACVKWSLNYSPGGRSLFLAFLTCASPPRSSSPASTSKYGKEIESLTKIRVVNSTSMSIISPTPYVPPGVPGADTDSTVGVTSPAIRISDLAPRVSGDQTGGRVGSASMVSSYLERTAASSVASVVVGR